MDGREYDDAWPGDGHDPGHYTWWYGDETDHDDADDDDDDDDCGGGGGGGGGGTHTMVTGLKIGNGRKLKMSL